MFNFSKYTAFGNVYIVVDPAQNEQFNFATTTQVEENLIKEICSLNFGIGSDGIIIGPIFDKEKITSSLQKANFDAQNLQLEEYFFCRIFNPDSSEAEKSGNGTRIFAQYLIDKNFVKNNKFKILTIGGVVQIEVIDENLNILKSDIGIASFDLQKIGIASEELSFLQKNYTFRAADISSERKKLMATQGVEAIEDFTFQINCVSVGNPHCVIIKDSTSEIDAKRFGSLIENNKIFKNRINVQFAEILNRGEVKIFIWERGAGFTLSSGTSSAAVASVCYKLNLCDEKIKIITQGGDVLVCINDEKTPKRENFSISIEGKTKLIEEGVCFF